MSCDITLLVGIKDTAEFKFNIVKAFELASVFAGTCENDEKMNSIELESQNSIETNGTYLADGYAARRQHIRHSGRFVLFLTFLSSRYGNTL